METIKKTIGEGPARGELYRALAYSATDVDSGRAIKQVRFNPDSGSTAIIIGDSTTAITLATYAQKAISIYTTTASADSSNNAMPVYVSATMTVATGVGRAAEFVLNITNVKLGGWCNALKGKLDCKTTGTITGIASGICAELYLAGGNMATGTYAALEVEVVCPASWTGANAKYNFMYLAASGNTVTYFDELGSLMQIVGLSAGSGSLYYNETLRIRMDTTAKYIPLSTVEGTYTTAYPIVLTCATDAITITQTDAAGGINSILINNTFTAQGAIAHKAIESNVTYTPATSGTGVPIAIAGKVTLAANQTHSGLYMWGVQGGIKFLGGSTVASSQIAAGRFVLEEADAVTYTSGNIAGIYVDNLITSPMASESSGQIDLIRIANHGGLMDNAINVYGPNLTNLFYLGGCTTVGCLTALAADVASDNTAYKLKISIDGNTHYLAVWGSGAWS